jgi:hypothetical protein
MHSRDHARAKCIKENFMQIHSLPKHSRSRVSLFRALLFCALAGTSFQLLVGEDAQNPLSKSDAKAAQQSGANPSPANSPAGQDDHAFLEQVEKAAGRNEPPATIPGPDRATPSEPATALPEKPALANVEQPKPPSTAESEEKESGAKARKEQPRQRDEERHAKTQKREKRTEIAKGSSSPEPVLEAPQGSGVSRDLFVPRRKQEAPVARNTEPVNRPPLPAGTTVTTVTSQFKGADGRIYVSTKRTTTIPRTPKPDARALLKPFFETFHPGPGN